MVSAITSGMQFQNSDLVATIL